MKFITNLCRHLAQRTQAALRGDTFVEVTLAIGVLSFIVMGVSVTMITTLTSSQKNLEETMAQTEIENQTEALRFIHNAYNFQRTYKPEYQQYSDIWHRITEMAIVPSEVSPLNSVEDCNIFYNPKTADGSDNPSSIYNTREKSFLLNIHRLQPTTSTPSANPSFDDLAKYKVPTSILIDSTVVGSTIFQPALLQARTIYNGDTLEKAEGIWVTATCSDTNVAGTACADHPQFYDFYVRTCWDSTTKHIMSTTGSIVRLHNPDLLTVDANGELSPSTQLNYTITYVFGDDSYAETPERHTASGKCTMSGNTCTGGVVLSSFSLEAENSKVLAGWSLTPGGTRVSRVYPSKDQPDITVYALWQDGPSLEFYGNASGERVYNLPPTTYGIYNHATGNYDAKIRPEPMPERAGYLFLGWDTNPSARVPRNKMGDTLSLTPTSGATKLYAIWKPANRITFNPNGDNVSSLPGTVQGTWRGGRVLATIPDVKPKRPHYIFLGYSENPSADFGDDRYQPGTTLELSRDINLYAIWEYVTFGDWAIILTWSTGYNDLDSHTYVCSGSSCGGPAYYSRKTGTYYGTSLALDRDDTSYPGKETTSISSIGNNSVVFCVDAYNGSTTFSGTNATIRVVDAIDSRIWTIKPRTGGSGSMWTALRIMGGEVSEVQTFGGCNTTPPAYSLSVRYDANGGSGAPASTTVSGTVGQARSFQLSSATPTRTGYTFAGWSRSSGASTPEFLPGATVSTTLFSSGETTITLYAVWKDNSMQAFTADACSAKSDGSVFNLVDKRTNKSYRIRKMSDDSCWMIQNLYLTGELLLTSSQSAISGTYSLPASSNTEGFSSSKNGFYAGTHVDDTSDNTSSNTGSYFSWNIATAGGRGSVCPSGWQLPTAGDPTVHDHDSEDPHFNSLILDAYLGNNASMKNGFLPALTGFYYFDSDDDTAKRDDLGTSATWWSASTSSSSAYAMSYSTDDGFNITTDQKFYGYSVRCVKQSY